MRRLLEGFIEILALTVWGLLALQLFQFVLACVERM